MQRTNFSDYLTQQLQVRTSDAGEGIRTTAQTVRRVAEQLRGDANTAVAADLADRGAELVDRIGTYVSETSIEQMLADAESLSRQRPWIVATAGIAVGIVASRLLKSTAARRQSMAVGT